MSPWRNLYFVLYKTNISEFAITGESLWKGKGGGK